MRRTIQTPFTSEAARASWDRAADIYAAAQSSGRDFYRYEFFGPAQIEMCGNVGGLAVLDVGSASGYLARALADRGAHVTAVDISPRMIANARRIEEEAPRGIDYRLLDAANLDAFDAGSFDLAASCVAMQDFAEAGPALREVRRVLRRGGRFVISIVHPCTDLPHRAWARDGAGAKAWLEVDHYFDRAVVEYDWNWGTGFATAFRHRPLEDWFDLLFEAGFELAAFREPRPTPESLARRPELEDAARVPYFAMFELAASAGAAARLGTGQARLRPGPRDDTSTRSWEAVADDWVVHADTNDYRNHFLLPRTLAMIGDVRDRTILDLGCGEGGYGRELARRGARVIGVDGSATLVAVARARAVADGLAIQYVCANASALAPIGDASVEHVLASMSLMDVEDYAGAVGEAHRVLAPGGELLMSITHPCFSTRASRWIRDEAGRPVSFAMDRYFEREAWDDLITPRFRAPVIRRHRPLEDYLGEPLAAGFRLAAVLEPTPTADELRHSARFAYLTRVPYFLFLRWKRV